MEETKEGLYGSIVVYSLEPIDNQGLYGHIVCHSPSPNGKGLFGSIFCDDPCRGWGGERISVCELYQLYFSNGASAFFCNHDVDISYDGHFYQAIPMRKGAIGLHSDLQIDNVPVDMGLVGMKLVSKVGDNTLQLSIPQAVRSELFRNATVRIISYEYERELSKFVFEGTVSQVGWNSGMLSLGVASVLDRLNEKVPKIIYSELCQHRLYDNRCGITRGLSTYTASGTVSAIDSDFPDTKVISDDLVYTESYPQGWWFRGEIEFINTGSLNYGIRRSIISHSDDGSNYYVETSVPFPSNISVSDPFIVYAGCDRTGVTCTDKFNNYSNFFGFEYIPRPETLQASL